MGAFECALTDPCIYHHEPAALWSFTSYFKEIKWASMLHTSLTHAQWHLAYLQDRWAHGHQKVPASLTDPRPGALPEKPEEEKSSSVTSTRYIKASSFVFF